MLRSWLQPYEYHALIACSTLNVNFGLCFFKELDDILELEKQPKMGSSFAQTTFNALNIVVGIALLSVPYTIGQVGLLGIPILVLYAGICVYTGVLLRKCMDAYSGMRGYPDIGWAAFGPTGRIIVSVSGLLARTPMTLTPLICPMVAIRSMQWLNVLK